MTRERRTRRKGTRGEKDPREHPSRTRIAMTPPLDLARLRARDPERLAALVRELSPQLLAVIRGYARDDDHADELLQECWVHILERLDSYRARGPFAGWAVAVTRNVCSSSLRRDGREGRARVALDELIDVPGDIPDADERLAHRRLRTALFKALGKLPGPGARGDRVACPRGAKHRRHGRGAGRQPAVGGGPGAAWALPDAAHEGGWPGAGGVVGEYVVK